MTLKSSGELGNQRIIDTIAHEKGGSRARQRHAKRPIQARAHPVHPIPQRRSSHAIRRGIPDRPQRHSGRRKAGHAKKYPDVGKAT